MALESKMLLSNWLKKLCVFCLCVILLDIASMEFLLEFQSNSDNIAFAWAIWQETLLLFLLHGISKILKLLHVVAY